MNDLTFFTNETGQTLGDRFNKIIKSNTKYFDVLVGYFRTSGFYQLYEALEDVEKHLSEVFKFVKRNTTILEAKKIFENELNENKKIGMVFITERGKKDEPILGIFTPWDLAGKLEEN